MDRKKILEEALQAVEPLCTIVLGMGMGKTYLGLKVIENYGELKLFPARCLIVIPKLSIRKTWIDEISKHGINIDPDNITFTTYLSLTKHDPANYDYVILDECHSLLPRHEPWLKNARSSVRMLGLTGTPPRKNNPKHELIFTYLPIRYRYEVQDAIDSNILNSCHIIVHYIPLNAEQGSYWVTTKSGKKFPSSEIKTYEYYTELINNELSYGALKQHRIMRMKALMSFSSKTHFARKILGEIKKKCLVFCNTKEQADFMTRHVYYSGHENSEYNLQLFKKGIINRLSCVLQLNEGVNIPDLEEAIILHSYGNEVKLPQRLARTLRLSPDKVSTVHILCYRNTVDEEWVESSLKSFEGSQITKIYH